MAENMADAIRHGIAAAKRMAVANWCPVVQLVTIPAHARAVPNAAVAIARVTGLIWCFILSLVSQGSMGSIRSYSNWYDGFYGHGRLAHDKKDPASSQVLLSSKEVSPTTSFAVLNLRTETRPVGGLKCSDGPSDRILPVLDLGADTAHPLGPYDEVQLGGLGQRLQLAEGMAGKAATGWPVVDADFGTAPEVLATKLWEFRVCFHRRWSLLRFSPLTCPGRKERTGAATGLQGTPPPTVLFLWGLFGQLTAQDRWLRRIDGVSAERGVARPIGLSGLIPPCGGRPAVVATHWRRLILPEQASRPGFLGAPVTSLPFTGTGRTQAAGARSVPAA